MDAQDVGRANEYLRSNIWPTGTRVQLLQVPWDSDYRDVVAWESAAARDQWFEDHLTESWTEVNFNYLWPGQPVAVPVPYSTAYKYNYIAVTNPQQPVDDEGPVRTYYYFITQVDYLSPQASNIYVQLDVMTTYCSSIALGMSYVDRGHIAMANANLRPETYNEFLTIPEGLDIGADYAVVAGETIDLSENDWVGPEAINVNGCWLMVVSTADLEADYGTVSSPEVKTAKGGLYEQMPSGCSQYIIKPEDTTKFMYHISTAPWVAQCIIDMFLVPADAIGVDESSAVHFKFGEGSLVQNTVTAYTNWSSSPINNESYSDGLRLWDSAYFANAPEKLRCYPYTVITVDCFNGTQLMLKPELCENGVLRLHVGAFVYANSPRIVVYPVNYNAFYDESPHNAAKYSPVGNELDNTVIPSGDSMNNMLVIGDLPHVTTVNNSGMLSLAQNAHTRAYNYQAAGWARSKGLAQAENAAETQRATISTNRVNAREDIAAQARNAQRDFESAGRSSTANTLTGIVGSALTLGTNDGDLPGLGLFSDLMGIGNNMYQSANSAGTAANNAADMLSVSLANQNRSLNTQRSNVNKNYELAQYAANGDYHLAIASIQAAAQDAQLQAPSVVGQLGGDPFNYAKGLMVIRATVRTIQGAARQAVISYFQRYGYAAHRWHTPGRIRNMLCMSKFAYWKLQETTLQTMDGTESERMTVRGIFEKGVTLWDTPEDIGHTQLGDNKIQPGHYL